MKKKSASQSAFFNLRLLMGLFMAQWRFSGAAGLWRVLRASAAEKLAAAKSINPLVPALFDCSKIRQLGIDKQENFRAGAIMIHCGEAEAGSPSPVSASSKLMQKLLTWRPCLARQTSTWSPAPTPLLMLSSRRRTLRLIQIIPSR